jgi:hypothetical protein
VPLVRIVTVAQRTQTSSDFITPPSSACTWYFLLAARDKLRWFGFPGTAVPESPDQLILFQQSGVLGSVVACTMTSSVAFFTVAQFSAPVTLVWVAFLMTVKLTNLHSGQPASPFVEQPPSLPFGPLLEPVGVLFELQPARQHMAYFSLPPANV